MKEDLNKLEVKIDRLDEKFDGMNAVLIINTEHLSQHMKRTALLETRVAFIEKHIYLVNAVLKVGVGLGGTATFVAAVLEIIHLVR